MREARAPAGREETFWHPLQGSAPTQGFTRSNDVVVVVVFVFVVVDVVVVVLVIVVIGLLTKGTHLRNMFNVVDVVVFDGIIIAIKI